MSIDPSKTPFKGNVPPQGTPETAPPTSGSGGEEYSSQSIDPAGIWAKFLSSQSGKVATPEEVKLFLQSFQKMLQVLVQQDQRAFERARQKLKEAEEG